MPRRFFPSVGGKLSVLPNSKDYKIGSAGGGGGGGCDITAGDNLNHWWKLNTGDVSATDEGTTLVTRRNLTLNNVTTATNGNHTSTEDVNIFNGTSAYAQSGNLVSDFASIASCVFSVSFWVKLTATPATNDFLCQINQNGGWSNGWGVLFGGTPQEIRFYTGQNSGNQYASIASPSVDTWTNIVCTYDFNSDPKVRMIYKDGVAGTNIATYNAWGGDACGGVTQRAGALYFGIGSAMYGATPTTFAGIGYYTECELSDFRIYDICLTEEQVQNIYCEGSGDTWP